ncbi:hypothetical protein NQ315_005809 [Exocentrus adspersus]|uniref:Uncharacterized protein n=1 Tax=Exocentrus adspersus TaxID=1586481 RepID=A0AAV8VR49_9CUCU|nr:hypothetical protein NQ315_005809 [Exocentrus adspersus]
MPVNGRVWYFGFRVVWSFKCLCLCIVIEKRTWYPNQKLVNNNKTKIHRAILKKRFNQIEAKKSKNNLNKPEWLKEWTISKGWVHNKSHLLDLGRNNSTENIVILSQTHAVMENKTYQELSDNSSVSLTNIDDLISITSHTNNQESTNRNTQKDFNKIETISNSDDTSSLHEEIFTVPEKKEQQNMSNVFNKVSENYRKKFPEHCNKYPSNDLSLPEIYKERLLMNKHRESNILLEIWKYIKPKRRKRNSYNCKFTVNELYDKSENNQFKKILDTKSELVKSLKRNNLSRNIALYNTLNSKTNLHEDTIYECSEENSNNNSLSCKSDKNNTLKARLKTEKYVIRHIRVRIMLSMRVGKVKKVYKNQGNNANKRPLLSIKNEPKEVSKDEEEIQARAAEIHEEQKRIGNGKTSIKIQNMSVLAVQFNINGCNRSHQDSSGSRF